MHNSSKSNLLELNSKIIKCSACSRLVNFRDEIAKKKRKMYKNEVYWGKPITGFGDINANLMIIGLAPAAHGGNRTGRVFTGDKSSDFLFKCLNEVKISNQNSSTFLNSSFSKIFKEGKSFFVVFIAIEICIADGKTSLVDWDLFT